MTRTTFPWRFRPAEAADACALGPWTLVVGAAAILARMGTWGRGPFESDEAMDWLAELTDGDDLDPIDEALAAVTTEAEDYIDLDLCAAALAAAEVVAALAGRRRGDLPEELDEWLAGRAAPPPSLVVQAREAVASVLAESELRELWEEAGDLAAWGAVLDELQTRLA